MTRRIEKHARPWGATSVRISAVLLIAVGSIAPDFGYGRISGAGGNALAAQPKSQRKRVVVVRPHKGGIQRTTNEPGIIEAFDYADLYAKISGYLKKQPVDIGDSVKEGDVIAEIDAPE